MGETSVIRCSEIVGFNRSEEGTQIVTGPSLPEAERFSASATAYEPRRSHEPRSVVAKVHVIGKARNGQLSAQGGAVVG